MGPAGCLSGIALACVATHHHQTFNGWWRGADVEMRLEHGLVPPELTDLHRQERQVERGDLLKALMATGIVAANAANVRELTKKSGPACGL